MKAVGTRELKNRLSEYLRQVRAGEEILVTDRGDVVAELRPPRRLAPEPLQSAAFFELVQTGLATVGLPNDPTAYQILDAITPPGTAARLLAEERGER